MSIRRSKILGTGHYLPPIVRTNADLEKMVDTTDEWIVDRTGIRTRHIAPDGTGSSENIVTSDMATAAGKRALEAAGLKATDIDMIIVGTVTGDVPMPATAVFVQQKLGATHCASFDISAACAGFIFGLSIADKFIRAGAANRVLVIGVELLSRILDWGDRTTCILFGDGAGAVILGPTTDDSPNASAVLATSIHSDGALARSLIIPAGGSELPLTHERLDQQEHKVHMRGQDIFKVAVKNLVSASQEAMRTAGISPTEIDWVCPHQANLRIIDQVVSRLQVAPEKVLINIDRVGNTSSASVPILLDENIRSGKIKPGDTVLMCALGAGVAWGGALLRM